MAIGQLMCFCDHGLNAWGLNPWNAERWHSRYSEKEYKTILHLCQTQNIQHLTLSCQYLDSINFLGDEPFKFLGRKISGKKDGHNRIEIKDSCIKNLEKTGKANITGPVKMWLYNSYVVAFITWPFTICDLPISFGEELKAISTRYLKQWLGVTKSITETALYRSKDHFGLRLTNPEHTWKECRYAECTCSNTAKVILVKDYMITWERDKPPLNGLGIPIKPRVWKPTNALEDAELNFYLDSIAMGQQCNVRVNKKNL